MQSKRILLSLLTVLLICFLAGTATVSATEAAPSLDLTVDISCSDAVTADPLVVQPGDTLTVSVAVEGNPGFTALQISLSYDPNLLEVVTDDAGIVHTLNTDVFGEAELGSEYNLAETDFGIVRFVYLPLSRAEVTSATDTGLFELSFKVKEGAHGDLNIGLQSIKAYDLQYEKLATTAVNDAAYVHTYTDAPVVEDATCVDPGTKTYTCADCGESLVVEVNDAAGHDLAFVPLAYPTCDKTGNIAYYFCNVCEKLFLDEGASTEISLENAVTPAKGHTLQSVAAVAPTCVDAGNVAYWACDVCDKNFADEAATQELTDAELTLPATGHTLTKIDAVAATCEAAGTIEHWNCSVCEKNFGEEAATTELADADLVVAALGHNWVIDEAVKPTYSAEGKTEGKHCDRCNIIDIPQDVIPQKSLTWLWILIAVVVVAAAGVLAYFFIFKKKVKRY